MMNRSLGAAQPQQTVHRRSVCAHSLSKWFAKKQEIYNLMFYNMLWKVGKER